VALRLAGVCLDAIDPVLIGRFWSAVLGRTLEIDEDGDALVRSAFGDEAVLWVLAVPEPKAGKNRLHFDLRPDDQQLEVRRLEALGARRVSVGQADDVSWVVMADPEGNEFCVLAP